jgi:hypothetical protein
MFFQDLNAPQIAATSLGLFGLWAAVGYCPDWWPWRPGRKGPPPPPWWRVIGVLGGILGGYIFSRVFDAGAIRSEAVYAASTAVGAYVGSVILQSIVGVFAGGRGAADVGNIDMPGPG